MDNVEVLVRVQTPGFLVPGKNVHVPTSARTMILEIYMSDDITVCIVHRSLHRFATGIGLGIH